MSRTPFSNVNNIHVHSILHYGRHLSCTSSLHIVDICQFSYYWYTKCESSSPHQPITLCMSGHYVGYVQADINQPFKDIFYITVDLSRHFVCFTQNLVSKSYHFGFVCPKAHCRQPNTNIYLLALSIVMYVPYQPKFILL